MTKEGVLEEFESRVTKEYISYILSVISIDEADRCEDRGAICRIGRDKGIVLRWSARSVNIVDNGVKVRTFKNPYGM